MHSGLQDPTTECAKKNQTHISQERICKIQNRSARRSMINKARVWLAEGQHACKKQGFAKISKKRNALTEKGSWSTQRDRNLG